MQLRCPYPRGVSEPAIYHEANVLTDVDSTNIETKKKSNSKSNLKPNKAAKFISSLDLSVSGVCVCVCVCERERERERESERER